MQSTTKRVFQVLLIVLIVIILDRVSKELAIHYLKYQPAKNYLGGFFRLTYAENTGAFLSLGANATGWLKYVALYFFPLVLLVGLFVYIIKAKSKSWLPVFSMSMVLGGGLSNVFDRLSIGKVTDFMVMSIGSLHTGVFNISDVFIMFGLFLMLFFGVIEKRDEDKVATPIEK